MGLVVGKIEGHGAGCPCCHGSSTKATRSKVTKAPRPKQWTAGQRLIERGVNQFARSFQAIVKGLQDDMEVAVRRSLENPTFNLVGWIRAIDWDQVFGVPVQRALEAVQFPIIMASRRQTARSLGLPVTKADHDDGGDPAFDTSFPGRLGDTPAELAAIEWIRNEGAKNVTFITEATKAAIAEILEERIRDGTGIYPMAKEIQQIIGLTRPQAGRLARLRSTGDYTDRQLEAIRKKMLKRRAFNIARTETITARNVGQLQEWESQQAAGQVSGQSAKKWVAAYGIACPVCKQYHKHKAIPLKDTFRVTVVTKSGKKRQYQAKRPPAHPSCRCSLVLVSAFFSELQPGIDARFRPSV